VKSTILTRAVVVLCMLLPALAYQYYENYKQSTAKSVISSESLPEFIGDWTGRNVELTEDEKQILHTPAASQRIYVNAKTGDAVQILLVQINNTQNAHDPRFCMTGAGYRIANQKEIDVNWANSSGLTNRITSVLFEKETNRVYMYYWLQTPDDVVADMSSGFKLEGIKRALRGQSTRGIAVRVICLTNQQTGDVTTEQAGIDLWREIDGRLDILQLAKEI